MQQHEHLHVCSLICVSGLTCALVALTPPRLQVYATNGNLSNAIAISSSLFMIVMTSVVLGTGLPFLLARVGVDPANAGTSIQVVMVRWYITLERAGGDTCCISGARYPPADKSGRRPYQ